MKTYSWLILGAVLSAGCGGGEGGAPGEEPEPEPEPGPGPAAEGLVVYPVAWNRMEADVGVVASVADGGETVVVLGSKGAIVIEHGEVASTDPAEVDWRSSAILPAADRSGDRWTVGIDKGGGVQRIQPRVALEDISARYGLEDDVVLAATTSGEDTVFGLDAGVAVADGEKVTHYETGPFSTLAGSQNGRIAMAGSDIVQAFDLGSMQITTFKLPGAAHVTFDPEGRVVAATSTSVYREDEGGALALLYEPEDAGETLHGLVTSGDQVWLAIGTELGVVQSDTVVLTTGLALAPDAALIGAGSGDVWALAGGGLLRFSAERSHGEEARSWDEQIGPIVAAHCNRCHLPDGAAGIDLSTYATWVSRRAAISQRVVVERSMPPPGFEFADADRAAIAAWVEGGR
jgi:mono/diheme cytochrome c family protein